ncbi:hypothetical protein MAL08_06815 [Leptospira noguchii]|uniref:hypothetical protein n=1 Tax=Leptospira noguchii TaxID=28182 RepID=UPI001FB6ED43|nr:hypothetical protein [Leptospira noguchii]UOG38987.1 hypothetical protein MAL08_06815 [Leptospira noguchii]
MERKARLRAILTMKFASDSPQFSYVELTLSYSQTSREPIEVHSSISQILN